MLLVEEGGSVFFTDVRYDTQAHEEVQAAKVVISRKGALPSLGEWLGARRKRARGWTIAIESEHFTIAEKKRLSQVRPVAVSRLGKAAAQEHSLTCQFPRRKIRPK